MASTNSRVNQGIDLLLGYLGLFLIGLIGWACDHLAATRTPERPLQPRPGRHAGLLRK
jgi:hypothetical protein